MTQMQNSQKSVLKIVGIIFLAIGPIVFAGVNALNGYDQIWPMQIWVVSLCFAVGGLLIGFGEYRATQSMTTAAKHILVSEVIALMAAAAFYVVVWVTIVVIALTVIGNSNIP